MKTIYGLKITQKNNFGKTVGVGEEFYPGTTLDKMVRNVKGLSSKQRCDLKSKPVEVEHPNGTKYWLEVIEKEKTNEREEDSNSTDTTIEDTPIPTDGSV